MFFAFESAFNNEEKENKNIHGIALQKHLPEFYPNSIWLNHG